MWGGRVCLVRVGGWGRQQRAREGWRAQGRKGQQWPSECLHLQEARAAWGGQTPSARHGGQRLDGEPLSREKRENKRLSELPWGGTGLSRRDRGQHFRAHGRRGSSVPVWKSRQRPRGALAASANGATGLGLPLICCLVAQRLLFQAGPDEGCATLTVAFSGNWGTRALRAQDSGPRGWLWLPWEPSGRSPWAAPAPPWLWRTRKQPLVFA